MGISIESLMNALPYLLQSLKSDSRQNSDEEAPTKSNPNDSLIPTENTFISQVLEEKSKSLKSLLALASADLEHTRSLERALIAYLDAQILKVENHLLQLDFQENRLGKNVMQLRTQMQQQFFQLEQEKVRIRAQLNMQLLQINREIRASIREVHEVEMQRRLFSKQTPTE